MELSNDFRVELPVERAWAVLTDLPRIAPCVPGAQLQDVFGGEHRGTLKVKVGPVTTQYAGKVTFLSQDPKGYVAVLRAEGRETRGEGVAEATITASLTEDAGATLVSLSTDLHLTGRVAQFGRGVLPGVSAKLVDQFVDNLERTVLAGEPIAPIEAVDVALSDPMDAVQPDADDLEIPDGQPEADDLPPPPLPAPAPAPAAEWDVPWTETGAGPAERPTPADDPGEPAIGAGSVHEPFPVAGESGPGLPRAEESGGAGPASAAESDELAPEAAAGDDADSPWRPDADPAPEAAALGGVEAPPPAWAGEADIDRPDAPDLTGAAAAPPGSPSPVGAPSGAPATGAAAPRSTTRRVPSQPARPLEGAVGQAPSRVGPVLAGIAALWLLKKLFGRRRKY